MIEDTGWASACMTCRIAHLAHLSKLTSRFLISIGPFAEIRGGSSAMQASACVSTAMVASTLLQHTALRGIIESERLDRLDRVWYKNRYLVSSSLSAHCDLSVLCLLTSRFLIPLGPFAEIRGGISAMQAFAGVCAPVVACVWWHVWWHV